MPWSIFTQGGGDGAAETWAYDLLKKLGVPASAGNAQFIYDWEVSEGGGGKYNPLNQGPVPGHPSLTTTGSQFGGGAADFASISAGLQGASDYLHMPAYRGILSSLKSNNPASARSALIASPWAASHYGNGSAFSNSPLPGHKNKIKGTIGSGGTTGVTTSSIDCGSALSAILGGVNGIEQYAACKAANSVDSGSGGSKGIGGFADLMERAGLILLGALMIIIGILILTRAPSAAMGALGVTARTSRQLRAINPPSRGPTETQTADRAARLELAQRNAAIGEQKAAIAASKEKRLGGEF